MSTPSTSVAVTQPNLERRSLLMTMGARYGVEPAKLLQTLKATAFKGATDDEMMALCIVANQYGLNPFLREIYAFPKKGGGIQAVIGIDGWSTTINNRETLDGIEFEEIEDNDGKPLKTTCLIYIKGRSRPVKITEWFRECYRNTDPWNQMAHRMLRHKALIQCARVAFGMSGVVDEDDARDIIDVTPERASQPLQLPPTELLASNTAAPATPMRQRKTQAERLNTVPAACPQCGARMENGICQNHGCESVTQKKTGKPPEPEPDGNLAGETGNEDPFAAREPAAAPVAPQLTVLERLAAFCNAEGIGFAVLRKWAGDQGHIARDVLPDKWEDVSEALAGRWLKNPIGLLTQLQLKKKEMEPPTRMAT